MDRCLTQIYECRLTTLKQVRATAIVRTACDDGKLPPDIDIASLSGHGGRLDVGEAHMVSKYQKFVTFLEQRTFLPDNLGALWGVGDKEFLYDCADLRQSWRENFRRTAYKFFMIGAVLSRTFQAPFFETKGENDDWDDFVGQILQCANEFQFTSDRDDRMCLRSFCRADNPEDLRDLLERHPIYDFTPTTQWEVCFGAIGEWLVNDSKRNCSIQQP